MNAIHNKIMAMLACMVLSLAMTGCKGSIDDNSANCPKGQVVTLRVDGPNNNPDDPAAVQDAVIYVFDKDGNLLETRATQINKPEHFDYPNAGELTFVGWCNTASTIDGHVAVTTPTPGTKEANFDVSQVPNGIVRDVTTYYDSPSDLFYGNANSANVANGKPETLDLYAVRQVGQIRVTVRGLKPYFQDNDENYTITIGTTKTQMDFTGVLTGPDGGLLPAGAFADASTWADYATPAVNIFPSNGALTVNLYKDNNPVPIASTTTVVINGGPIYAVANKLTDVLIVFTTAGTVNIYIENAQWGVPTLWDQSFSR